MGRKAPKKYEKMDYHEKEQFRTDMMKKYGLDRIKTQQNEITGRGGWDSEAEGEAISRAMANDYDTRRTIELAQETGNKKAAKLGAGISNIAEAADAERFMSKTHYNRMDSGGSYDGANDEGGVMNYWKDKSARQNAPEEPTVSKPKEEDITQNFKDLSARAQELVGMSDNTPGSTGPKSSSMSYDPDAGVSNAEAGDFLSDYSFKVKDRQKREGVPTRGAGAKAGRLN